MIGSVLIFLGICSVIISSVGVIRFPDFYTRLHAAGITDSSGATLLLIGFALQNGFSINTIKIILLILIIWVASSTNGYILARTYYKVKKKLLKKVKVLEILNVVLLLLLLTVTVFIVFSRHLVVSAVLMCVFSSLIALIYLIMNAPDVAITEASVGAGLSTIFTFAALSLIKNHKVNLSHNPITLFFMLFLAVCLSYFMIQLPDFGSHNAPIHLHVAPYYVENTEKATGIPNIVTAVLASFRGYDTFGETIVVFTAALCITLILKEEKEND